MTRYIQRMEKMINTCTTIKNFNGQNFQDLAINSPNLIESRFYGMVAKPIARIFDIVRQIFASLNCLGNAMFISGTRVLQLQNSGRHVLQAVLFALDVVVSPFFNFFDPKIYAQAAKLPDPTKEQNPLLAELKRINQELTQIKKKLKSRKKEISVLNQNIQKKYLKIRHVTNNGRFPQTEKIEGDPKSSNLMIKVPKGISCVNVFYALWINSSPAIAFYRISNGEEEQIKAENKVSTPEKVAALFRSGTYFDYEGGRLLKVEFKKFPKLVFSCGIYDREYGRGAAQKAIDDYLRTPPNKRFDKNDSYKFGELIQAKSEMSDRKGST